MRFERKDLLGLEELTKKEIELILETAESFKEISERPIKKVPILRGKTIVNLFFEPSTRTQASFGLAASRLSADIISVSSSSSSVLKGETLLDTARNIEAMRVDVVVIRHSVPGVPHFLARRLKASVVNAGDGAHEHPTQGLLDLLTIQDRFGKVKGVKVLVVGDIEHSRVARSTIWGLTKLGAKVSVCGPSTLMPYGVENFGVAVSYDLNSAVKDVDVIYVLRIQLERQGIGRFPSVREYVNLFGIDKKRLERAKDDVVIMHPGPINRGVELDPEVADGRWSVILNQVTNGLAVRMAVLYLLSGGELPNEEVQKSSDEK